MQGNKRVKFKEIVEKHFVDSLPLFMDFIMVSIQLKEFDLEYFTNGLLLQIEINNNKLIVIIGLFTFVGLQSFLFLQEEDLNDESVLFYRWINSFHLQIGEQDYLHMIQKQINDKLLARVGADDLYFSFKINYSNKKNQDQKYARIIMIFESDQKSGSHHIKQFLNKLRQNWKC
ncbi:unnamed protein product [Paramecium sonneborni]|uniref:Transmembrane protein n=1 Tax=Paramecium sonneborni TaxID=65129 RepID=A0A8S1K0C3_9CILI|nr:unnamed protein product [Paramecium sonneborni]